MRRWLSALIVTASIACAHAGTSATSQEVSRDPKSVYSDPKILNAQRVLSFRSRSAGPFRGTVEIPVTEKGLPDIFGLKTFPRMDDLMRRDIEDWLQGVTFKPGTKDGVPIASVFKMTFK